MNCIATALLRVSAALSFLACGYAHAADPAGLWQSQSDQSRYRVRHCGQRICVRIAGIAEGPAVRDIHNPDPSLRNREVIGIDIISASKSTGDNSWAGAIYSFRSGQTLPGRLQLEDDNTLSVTACLVESLLCQMQKLTRLE
jgi:uncharacterized protein (DUF2147 family)